MDEGHVEDGQVRFIVNLIVLVHGHMSYELYERGYYGHWTLTFMKSQTINRIKDT